VLNSHTNWIVAVVLGALLPVLSPAVSAQIPVDVDFGIREGVVNSGGIPLEVPNNHYFRDIYTTDQPKIPVTVGPAIGVLLDGRWYVRLEAARSRFGFHYARGTNVNFPNTAIPYVTSVTEGRSWQFPLLLTYMAGHGPVRPFGGGGISFGTSVRGTTSTTTTIVVPPPPPVLVYAPSSGTLTTTSSGPFDQGGVLIPHAFYITGGVDARISLLSIRPELRYAHWSGFDTTNINTQDDTILFQRNQVEFLVTVSVHPLGHGRQQRR
jgi:hypothetical protein